MIRIRKKSELEKQLLKMLKFYHSDGVSIFVGDKLCTPKEAVKIMMVHADMVFMGDYIMNNYGRLVQIRFNPVAV